jgi:hypothetical protein
VNNSSGLSSVRTTQTARRIKEQKKKAITKVTPSLINLQYGKEQSHGGTYPAGED